MSDRPTGANGKRNQLWGTTGLCPECGRCLCFACHPDGPCQDEHDPHLTVGQCYASSVSRSAMPVARGGWPFEAVRLDSVARVRLES